MARINVSNFKFRIVNNFLRKFHSFNECAKNFMGEFRSVLEFQVVWVCTPCHLYTKNKKLNAKKKYY